MGRTTVLSLALRASAAALAASALAASPAAAQETATATANGIAAWGIASSDLPADPDIRFGVLPNGMRYALKHHETPKGAAAVRFAFDVGKRDEGEGEINAAHFVEHMAFNGSTNIPEGELVKRLERLGLSFGADTNAETDVEHTTYKLDLPKTDAETVDAALTFMREIASELTIDHAAVDRERGILISEFNQRNVPALRRTLDVIRMGVPNSRFGPNLVGSPDSLRAITAERLRAFYEGYYRPDNATMVIVGDFDVDAMEAEIRKRFSDWKAKGTPRTNYLPTLGGPKLSVGSFTDPATPEIVQIDRVSSYAKPLNTAAAIRQDYLEAIANQALTTRFDALARQEGTPLVGGAGLLQDFGRSVRMATTLVIAKDGQWEPALAIAEQQLRQARQFGFTNAEVAEIKASILTNLTNAANQASGRKSAGIADAIANASLADRVVIAPATALAAYKAVESTIDAAAVSKAFADLWSGGPTLVHVATKEPLTGGDAAINAAFANSGKVAVAAPVEVETAAFAYDSFGTPGKIVADSTIADLGIRTLRFANGVQLNLKKTDFVPDQVSWRAEIGEGAQAFPMGKPGLETAFAVMIGADGLGKHDPEELRRILAGRRVTTQLTSSADALVSSGVTTNADIGMQLKLLAAQLTDPAWRPSTAAQWGAIAPLIIKQLSADPAQRFINALPSVTASGDSRVGIADPAVLTAVTLDDVRSIVGPQLANGAIELAVVGDIDEAAIIEIVAATLGALPARPGPGAAKQYAPLVFPADREVRTIYHDGVADQGYFGLAWPTDDGMDLRSSLARDLLAGVMASRMNDVLREELGATYTPEAFSNGQTVFDGYGYIAGVAPADPATMDQVSAVMKKIAGGLVAAPPTADELLRVRQPILERWERETRENARWAGLVVDAQSRPEMLQRRRDRAALMAAITPAEVHAEAVQYLDPAKALEIRSVPKPAK